MSRAILTHMWRVYICLPTPAEAAYNMHAWAHQTGIPGVVGAIDGTHIQVNRPCVNGEVYFNRKSYYSLNIQGTFLKRSYFDMPSCCRL